jgi:DNA-binding MarR family transcriptional regulator
MDASFPLSDFTSDFLSGNDLSMNAQFLSFECDRTVEPLFARGTLEILLNTYAYVTDGQSCDVIDPDVNLGFSLLEAGRLYIHLFEEHSRERSLGMRQCRALVTLAENEGVTQQRLADLIAVSPAALGHIIDQLEACGWAERRPRHGDRRARSLAITEEAKALLPFIRRIGEESQRAALAGLSQYETQILARALERVLLNLKSYRSAADAAAPPLQEAAL